MLSLQNNRTVIVTSDIFLFDVYHDIWNFDVQTMSFLIWNSADKAHLSLQKNEDDSIGTVYMVALQMELSIECFM